MLQALPWLGCSWCLVRLVQTGDQRWWIAFGLVTGVSLFSKYLIVFYLAALSVGIVATPMRRSLAQPWIYAGAALSLLMLLPNIMWQQQQGWPFLELGAAGAAYKNLALSPLSFFGQQLLLIGPLATPVWLAGLWAMSVRPANAGYRVFPIAYVLLFVLFIVSHGKAYYLAPIYPTLLGFGAVALEQWLKSKAARISALAAITAGSAFAAPMSVPVLPVNIAYASALGMAPSALAAGHARLSILPQHFADMFGWPQMAASIEAVYRELPPADQKRAVFFGQNYGEAAAIDIFGHGLPSAISGHNNYYLWGPRGHDGSVVIVIGGNRKEMEGQFRSVVQAGYINTPYAMPYETNRPIYVLRDARVPLPAMWPNLKHFK